MIADLVNRAWAHAKCPEAPLYLAGYDVNAVGGISALLSAEPTAYTETFIAGVEAMTGCVFKRELLNEREQLHHELSAVEAAYMRIEHKSYWTSDDSRTWRDLSTRRHELRKVLAQIEAIDEAGGQFGVGA